MGRMGLFVVSTLMFFGAVSPAHAAAIRVEGNDSTAIAAAIASAAPGDTVALSPGQYALLEPLQLKPDIRLEGAGMAETVLEARMAAPGVMIGLGGCDDAGVANLTLDGMNNPNAQQGVSASNARRLKLNRVAIRNLAKGTGFGPHAILFAGNNPARDCGVLDSEISDCVIENIAPDASFGGGIRFSWGSSRNRILRNTISNTGRGGIFTDNGAMDNLIRGNTVTGSHGEGLAIEVWGGSDGSVIEDNRMDHWLSVGGSDFCAVRRNVIEDDSGAVKPYGIEGIGSYGVYTDNVVGPGQQIGLSVSAPMTKQCVYWARNIVRACHQWGAQIQGEEGGAVRHYFYQCQFLGTLKGQEPMQYPGDEGHGFRMNNHCREFTFEECTFANNGRCGIQALGDDVNALRFLRCVIRGNGAEAVRGLAAYTNLEWNDCTAAGNGSDVLPPAKPFPAPPPIATFDAPDTAQTGQSVAFANTSAGTDAQLWDFGDGKPSNESAPNHIYAEPGTYRVTLIVWSTTGQAARAEKGIAVTP